MNLKRKITQWNKLLAAQKFEEFIAELVQYCKEQGFEPEIVDDDYIFFRVLDAMGYVVQLRIKK